MKRTRFWTDWIDREARAAVPLAELVSEPVWPERSPVPVMARLDCIEISRPLKP
jgi:hypothetical protein